MNIKSRAFAIVAMITFAILFLMNYIGNTDPDKLTSALMIAFAGVVGLTIGMWYVYRNKDDNQDRPDFD